MKALPDALEAAAGVGLLWLAHLGTTAAARALGLPDVGSVGSMVAVLLALSLASLGWPAPTERGVLWLASAERVLLGNLGLFVMPLLLARSGLFVRTEAATLARVTAAVTAGYGLTLALSALLARPMRDTLDAVSPVAPPRASEVPWATLAAVLVAAVLRAQNPLWNSVFALSVMVAAWRLSLCVPVGLRAVASPLVVASLVAYGALRAAGISPDGVLGAGSVRGGGEVLLALLSPSVVALSLGLFRRRAWLRAHGAALCLSLVGSVALGMLSTAVLLRALAVPEVWARAMLTRSVTTPVAVWIAPRVGADPSLAASIVLLTGVLAAATARPLLTVMGVRDPVVRAVAMGASGHALATAALSAAEPDAAGVSTLAFTLAAVVTAAGLAVPWVRAAVLALSLGG